MTEDNILNHIDEMTHFNCLGVDNRMIFNRLQSELDENYPEMARVIGSSLLGGYKIEKLIDQNQFGFTYLVKKINREDKQFVIKEFFPQQYVKRGNRDVMLMRTSLSVDELTQFNFMKNFFTGEIDNLEKLLNSPHPNIINIDNIVRNQSNTMYIIYTYDEGVMLEEYLKDKKGHFENNEIYNIINPILDAVGHLHTLKICHFDIKPENILIKKDGSLLLLGFEASSLFYDKYDKCYCNGYTPRYAAPEQISVEKNSSLNRSTDIYAIGTLLYRMVTGLFPPKASVRLEELLIKNEQDPYVSLEGQGILEKYDLSLLTSTDKALKFSNKDRFKHISRLKKSLNPKSKSKKKNYLYLSILTLSFIAIAGWNMFNPETKMAIDTIEKQVVKTDKLSMNDQNIIENNDAKKINVIDKDTKDKEKNVSKNGKHASVEQESKEQSLQNTQAVIVQNKTMKETNKTIVNPVLEKQVNVDAEPTFSKNENKNPVEGQNKVDVTLVVRLRNNIGTNKILVNNKALQAENFSAYKGEKYHIDISNPYYYPLHEERTFEELKEYPEQIFVPTLGKAKVYLKGLPANTQVTVHYQVNERNAMSNADNVSIHNDTYEVSVPAGKRFSLRFSNKAYKPFATDIFILKHGEALTQIYSLQKKDLPKIEKKEQAIIPTVKEKRLKSQKQKRIQKTEKTKSVLIHKKSRKKVEKKKEKKNIKLRKEKSKKENNKPSVTEKKKKTDVKKKTSVKRTTDFVWYCSAVAIGKEKISVKHADKIIAKRTVMQRCTKKFGANAGCRVLGCFLIR
jgi:serine/threonine protein kinase